MQISNLWALDNFARPLNAPTQSLQIPHFQHMNMFWFMFISIKEKFKTILH